MNYEEWISEGIKQGWCGPAVCAIHDGMPTTAGEDTELEIGEPCIHIIRLYADKATKKAVEANHAPSVWRQNK